MQPHPRTTWRHVGPSTWHLIRHAYLSGGSAPAVAARYGVSVSSLRKRAQREGWTKRRYALTCIQDPTTALDGAPDGAGRRGPSDAGAGAGSLPDGRADSLVRPPLPAEEAFARRLWPVPPMRSSVLARKALALADMALRQGRALDARRFADAARAIEQLDDHLPYTDDTPDPDAAENNLRLMIDYLGEASVRMALQLHRGEPIGEQYAPYVARYEAAKAADAAADGAAE